MDNMNQASEHIKEAAEVVSQYYIIAVRAFAGLVDKDKDNAETVLAGFLKYATVPIVNMEARSTSSLGRCHNHCRISNASPSKSYCLGLRIPEHCHRQCRNSFVEMMQLQDADFVIHIQKVMN
jgi:N-succinyl-L-ornithine transcarbamylase